jgi:hypothetical protein
MDLYGDKDEEKRRVMADAKELRTEIMWQDIEGEDPPPGLSGQMLDAWLREHRRESHPQHPDHMQWRLARAAEEDAAEREAAGLAKIEGGLKPEDVEVTEDMKEELLWQMLMTLDEYTSERDLPAYYDAGSGLWNRYQLVSDLENVQREVRKRKRDEQAGEATSGLAARMMMLEKEKADKTGRLKEQRLEREREEAKRKRPKQTMSFKRTAEEGGGLKETSLLGGLVTGNIDRISESEPGSRGGESK